MGEAQRTLEHELGRLEELMAYRESYMADQSTKKVLQAGQWQDYHKFLGRLNRAVTAQEQVVREGRLNQEAHRKRWAVKRQRLEALSRIVERYRTEELKEAERREAQLQDAQPFRRRVPGEP